MMYRVRHNFHLVDRSRWPLITGIGALNLTFGGVLFFHRYYVGQWLMALGFFIVLFSAIFWFRDIIREGTYQGHHTKGVKTSLKMGMILFIVSEIMFFLSFFWAYFHSFWSRTVELGLEWAPIGINQLDPWAIRLLNTVILLSSGVTITWSHHAFQSNNFNQALNSLGLTIILAIIFTGWQGFEYTNAGFTISDSVYGSTFYMATGFHGLHVIIGTTILTVQLLRAYFYNFNSSRLYGFEAGAWYWHFVDVVWLFLFVSVYWWGSI